MRTASRVLIAVATLLPLLTTRTEAADGAEYLEDVRIEIARLQEEWGVPGLAVGIIHNGEIALAEGFGSRDLAGEHPIDTATLFRIGSCSKALTAFSLALAIQQGAVAPNAPIRETLPDFSLADKWGAERATVADLLTHRSSLGRYSLLSFGSNFGRANLCTRIQHLPSATGFREDFAYSNLNYAIAAHVLEVATERSWEEYVRKEMLIPLSMTATCFTTEEMVASGNYALPYQKPLRNTAAPARLLELEKWDTFTPAGGVISNLDDLLVWLRVCLDGGQPILETKMWESLITPYVGRNYRRTGNNRTSAYGMGWNIYNYRGHHLVSHSGIVAGYCASVSFMPFEEIGVVVLTNLKHHSLHDALPRIIYDRVLQLTPYDHHGEYVGIWNNIEKQIQSRDDGLLAARIPDTESSLKSEAYVGRYENPAYGTVVIETTDSDGLVATFNDLVMLPLEHFHHDIWFARDLIRFEFDMLGFQFQLGPDGQVEDLQVREEMTKDPIHFTRVTG